MKLATFRAGDRISYGIIKGDNVIDAGLRLGGQFLDLHSVLSARAIDRLSSLAATQSLGDYELSQVRLLKPILNPGKILCVGVNYPERPGEYGDNPDLPKYPSVFVRFSPSLVAHEDLILRPSESAQLDYEGEVALVIGQVGRRIAKSDALKYVAGYTICNDGTIRDWVRHGKFNVTPGKNFEKSGALGPWIVTSDEIEERPLQIITRVNSKVRQKDTTDRMIFSIPSLISYISTFCTLEPGDILITGTPAGAGARLQPPEFLVPGDVVEVEVPQIGVLRNKVADEAS